jgi:hypothetical protein
MIAAPQRASNEPNARLVRTDTDVQFDIDGSFAGRLEVDRCSHDALSSLC